MLQGSDSGTASRTVLRQTSLAWTVLRRATLGPGLCIAATLAGCAGPEGAFLGTIDRPSPRSPDLDPAPRPPLVRRAERASPAAPAPAVVEAAPYVSPQGISISQSPQRFHRCSVEGRDLEYWVVGEGSQTLLVLGGQHGDERSSCELAFRFLEWVVAHPDQVRGRRLVIAPLVNPDGYARNSRGNARLVDLNRNFPSKNWKKSASRWHRPGPYANSEPETQFLLDLLRRYPTDRVVSIHGKASCVNWDGPAEELARAMARECGLPPKSTIGYPTPGSFGSYIGGDLDIPIVTLELTENQTIGKPFETYRRTLMTALYHPSPSLSAN